MLVRREEKEKDCETCRKGNIRRDSLVLLNVYKCCEKEVEEMIWKTKAKLFVYCEKEANK